ncbi:MAG TPA: hypothetical protein VGJ86_09935 [Acidimicrobiales bacterium]
MTLGHCRLARVRWIAAAACILLSVSGCGGNGGGRPTVAKGEAAVLFDLDEPKIAEHRPGYRRHDLVTAVATLQGGTEADILVRSDEGMIFQLLDGNDATSPSMSDDLAPGGIIFDSDGLLYIAHGMGITADGIFPGVRHERRQGIPEPVLRYPDDTSITAADVALAGDSVLIATRPIDTGAENSSLTPFSGPTAVPVDVQILSVPRAGGDPTVVAGIGRGCTTAPTSAADAQFSDLRGIVVDEHGVVLVADPVCHQVYEIDDGMVRPLLPPGDIHSPIDVTVAGEEVFVADYSTRQVLRLAADGREPEVFLDAAEDELNPRPVDLGTVARAEVGLIRPRSVSLIGTHHLLVTDSRRVLLVSTR